jgi:hypothetical protein
MASAPSLDSGINSCDMISPSESPRSQLDHTCFNSLIPPLSLPGPPPPISRSRTLHAVLFARLMLSVLLSLLPKAPDIMRSRPSSLGTGSNRGSSLDCRPGRPVSWRPESSGQPPRECERSTLWKPVAPRTLMSCSRDTAK